MKAVGSAVTSRMSLFQRYLAVLRSAAHSGWLPLLFVVFSLSNVLALWMLQGAEPPDAVFAYSVAGVHGLFEKMGADGRQRYLLFAVADFLWIMPLYVVLLGSLILCCVDLLKCDHTYVRWAERLALLPLVMCFFDIAETSCQAYLCVQHSADALTDSQYVRVARMGSASNGLKWSLLVVSVVVILGLWGLSYVVSRKTRLE
mmetsp:Transcript_13605/g.32392  ORF Transcript_13605/g.32392 Transcript_13605/m.32392 type:complete len:202 (-) Transcript_13605:89-694(-)